MTIRRFKPKLAGMNWYREPGVEILCFDNRANAIRFNLPGSEWYCQCTHGAQVYSASHFEAMHDMNNPDEWCEDCARVLQDNLRLERTRRESTRQQREGRGK